jgi:hypothetical protein
MGQREAKQTIDWVLFELASCLSLFEAHLESNNNPKMSVSSMLTKEIARGVINNQTPCYFFFTTHPSVVSAL